MQDLLSRKFLIAVMIMTVMAVALFLKVASVDQFIDCAKWIGGIFFTANVVEAGVGMLTYPVDKQ